MMENWTDVRGQEYSIEGPSWYDRRFDQFGGLDKAGFKLVARPVTGVEEPISVDLHMSGADLQALKMEGNAPEAVRHRRQLRQCFTEACRRAIYSQATSGTVEVPLSPKPDSRLGLCYEVDPNGEPRFLLTDTLPMAPDVS